MTTGAYHDWYVQANDAIKLEKKFKDETVVTLCIKRPYEPKGKKTQYRDIDFFVSQPSSCTNHGIRFMCSKKGI